MPFVLEFSRSSTNISISIMTTRDIRPRLLAEGCNKNTFAVGERGRADDAFCLVQQNGKWEVFYTERGHDSSPIFSSESEEEACDFFCRHIISLEHWHLVGWFIKEADAEDLEKRIRSLGAKPIRNDINFSGSAIDRYRVFVKGKDIFPLRQNIPGLPLGQIDWPYNAQIAANPN
jgi:hypothetical protein